MVFRIKRYSAVDLLTGFAKWEYFAEESIEKAKEFKDTLYSYDAVFGLAHKKGKLQGYFEGTWKTIL